jgi:hypothetical protein
MNAMNTVTLESVPQLAAGCRLNATGEDEDLLLIPEGALRMKGPARAIVELCDGQRRAADIVRTLCDRFATADPARIEAETLALLTRLRDRGAMECL